MPQVVNGIGTWYWGKDNVRACRDRCEFCGHLGDLRSYDTRMYFVVFFIPVFPLGRKRVLGDCPRCHKHRVIKYSDWERGRGRDLPGAVHIFEMSPGDSEAARQALGLSVLFQEEKHLPEIAAACRRSFARNFEIQSLLASAYEYFGHDKEAERIYRAYLKCENSFEAREALARNLLFQSRPDEAWDLLSHVLTEHRTQARGLLLLVAESYQSWGMHTAALDVLNAWAETFPELLGDPDYKRLQKISLKYKDSPKPVKSKLLVAPKTSSGVVRKVTSRIPMFIVVTLLLTAIGIFVFSSLNISSHRTVYVINALSAPYEVNLNGRRTTVRPKAFCRVDVVEGDLDVSVKGEGITVPNQKCRITTNFFTRPFTNPVFVLNPDRSALVLREEAWYGQRADSPPAGALKFYCGDLLIEFDGVDFPFQDLPRTIELPAGKPVKRSRVAHLGDLPPSTIAGVLASEWNTDKLKEWVRRLAASDADDPITAGLIANALEASEASQVLGKLCSMRPLRVEAHRMYQQLVEVAEPERDLAAEYHALLAESPDDPVRAYLLGRVTVDDGEAEALYARGRQSTPPFPHSLNALAFSRLVAGEFEEALPLVEEAMSLRPNHPGFHWTHRQVLEALGRFDEALSDLRKDKVFSDLIEQEIYLLVRADKSSEAKKRLLQLADDQDAAGRADDGRMLRQSLEGMLAYVNGNPEEMVKLTETLETPEIRFARAATAGNLDAAAGVISDLKRDKAFLALLLSLMVRETNQTNRADELLTIGVAALRAENPDARKVVPWLTGEADPGCEDALRLNLMPKHKAIVLAVLGHRFPEHRDRYFALAHKLNFDKRFPHLLIERFIE